MERMGDVPFVPFGNLSCGSIHANDIADAIEVKKLLDEILVSTLMCGICGEHATEFGDVESYMNCSTQDESGVLYPSQCSLIEINFLSSLVFYPFSQVSLDTLSDVSIDQ